MKKLLVFGLLLFGSFLLSGCDQRKPVELTDEELLAALNEVDMAGSLEDVIKVHFELELDLSVSGGDALSLVTQGDIVGTLEADLYFNVTDYQSFYAYGTGNIDVSMIADDETQSVKGEAMVYVTSGVIYLYTDVSYLGSTLTQKIKYENLFTEADFNDLKAQLTSYEETPIDEAMLAELPAYEMFTENGSYVMVFNEDQAALEAYQEALPYTLSDGSTLGVKLEITFSELIEKVSVSVNFDGDMTVDMNTVSGSFSFNASIDLSATAPKLPTTEELSNYVLRNLGF